MSQQPEGLDEEWAANSWEDGGLLVAGKRRPLVEDDRLARAVAPHLPKRGMRSFEGPKDRRRARDVSGRRVATDRGGRR